jgi:cell division protein FtsQ
MSGQSEREVHASVGAAERIESFDDPQQMPVPPSIQESLEESAQAGEGVFAPAPKVVDIKERLEEKARMRRRTIAMRFLIVLSVLAAVALIVWALFFSPLCQVKSSTVTIKGTNRWVTTSEVSKIVAPQTNQSLLLVSSGDLNEKISALPATESVSISKSFPNSLTITVSVRQPKAILKDNSGVLSVVDKDGTVMATVKKKFSGVPVIEVDDTDKELASRAVKQALSVLSQVPDPMLKTLSQVTAMTQDSVTTKTQDGHTIVWGNSSDMKLKGVVVQQLLANKSIMKGKTSIDVSAPQRPIVK